MDIKEEFLRLKAEEFRQATTEEKEQMYKEVLKELVYKDSNLSHEQLFPTFPGGYRKIFTDRIDCNTVEISSLYKGGSNVY